MTDPWPPRDYDPILAEMGRIVFSFNALERVAHRLVLLLVTEGTEAPAVQILLPHMNSVTAIDTLKSVAIDHYDGWILDHSLHLCEVFNRLREYRNYYVHGFKDIHLGGHASVHTSTARKGLRDHKLAVTAESMAELAKTIHEASGYGAHVYCHCAEIILNRPSGEPVPAMMPLPPKLEKPNLPRAEQQRQDREASEAFIAMLRQQSAQDGL